MKRAIMLLIFLFLLVFPVVSALELNMPTEIDKGETVLVSFSGNFIEPPSREDVRFYRGYTETSFEYEIAKIEDVYYIYFKTLGKSQNNYSINITGIKYTGEEGEILEQLSKNFIITNKTADFSFSPGFFNANEDFYIKLQNIKPYSLKINIRSEVISGNETGEFVYYFNNQEVTNEITLSPSITRNLYVKLDDLGGTTIRTITLSTDKYEYSIPAYILRKVISNPINESENETAEEDEEVIIEDNEDEPVQVTTNCTFFKALAGKCNLTTQENKTENSTLTNASKNNSSNSSLDYEVVKKGNKTVVIKDGEVINQTGTLKTCAEIKGRVCQSDQICTNQTIYAKDTQCCISECVKKPASKSTKTLGWIMIGFIIVMMLWFFLKKFRSTTMKKDPLLK